MFEVVRHGFCGIQIRGPVGVKQPPLITEQLKLIILVTCSQNLNTYDYR